jgi:hypothetical protein
MRQHSYGLEDVRGCESSQDLHLADLTLLDQNWSIRETHPVKIKQIKTAITKTIETNFENPMND